MKSSDKLWGMKSNELLFHFPCDGYLENYHDAYYRGVTIHADADVVFRWICQMKVAPYSYDWIDNFGRKSPQEVTSQMVYNFVNGGASVSVLARHAGAEVRVADIGVNFDFEPDLPIFHKKVKKGTSNFTKGPAMSRDEAVASIEAGISIVDALVMENRPDMIGTGDMGIANTTPSTAIIAAFSKLPISDLTGRGTGIDDDGLTMKIKAIKKGIEVNHPDASDPIDVLSKVGGLEIGALAGLVIGAAAHGIPVVCDGLISTAGALIACKVAPVAKAYLFASHRSQEAGHRFMHERLELDPLIDLGFRLGEGTGAAVAMELLDASTRKLADIKTFEEVGIVDAN